MEKIQLILKEDVAHLGKSGELVAVKPGYGRNYLIPQGLAIHATAKNVARMEHEKRVIETRNAKLLKDAQAVATIRNKGIHARCDASDLHGLHIVQGASGREHLVQARPLRILHIDDRQPLAPIGYIGVRARQVEFPRAA